MLRNGKYKPTGRGKPASEYLINYFIKNKEFPFINNIVDINNYISFSTQLPISTFDSDKCDNQITIRHGVSGEKYIFNNSGQEIDLEDLLLVSDSNKALGNPVKDSMKTKISNTTKNIFATIYSTNDISSEEDMQKHLETFQNLLEEYANAKNINKFILR
jgi:DNA/RNA-binding domain of Phe-tRNA-synthetase-like protein